MYITGAWLFNALDGDNLDAVEQEARSLDLCLSHASPFGGFHYHSWTPCLKSQWTGSKTDAPGLCKDEAQCTSDWESLVLENAFFSKAQNGGILGIAKDGHLLIGPWNDNGQSWGCNEHDICNGRFDSNGNYQYVATGTFPYHLGCWGPAAQQEYRASCSSSSCGT